MSRRTTVHALLTAALLWPSVTLADSDLTQAANAATVLKSFCLTCHSGTAPEGDLSLEDLSDVAPANASMWQRVLTQLATGEMPPDGERQPPAIDREVAIQGIVSAMKALGVEARLPQGPLPTDGNLIDHDRLFSGANKGPAWSPSRFWRRSQSQYDSLMERLWVIPKLRYEKSHLRDDPKWAGYSYSQPFPSLDPSHFTNYSGSIHADEAVLRALMDAGGQIAERLTSDAPAYANELQPPIAFGIPSIRRGSPWERFKVGLPTVPAEFVPFVSMDVEPDEDQQAVAIRRAFEIVLNRLPTDSESERYGRLLRASIEKSGALAAIRGLITAVIVSPEFVFRMEVGLGGTDQHGRRMLSANELVYAISLALTDDGPDEELRAAAHDGRLETKADVEREVRRMLGDDSTEKQRRLRFFQEFFGYHRATDVFKDRGGWHREVPYLVRDADLLVEYVLQQDRNVLAELLTTDRYFVAYPVIDNPELLDAIIENTRKETLAAIERQKQRGKEIGPHKQGEYTRTWALIQGRELIPRTVHNDPQRFEMSYIKVYGIDGNEFAWTRNQPIEVPGRRAGILTHPAWLVAHSGNFDNDIVRRGHWIRTHLLAGTIPDVPLDVEAQVPDEPEHTLRHRMRVTQAERCIRCHRRMDPLGFPFEIYDHFGHYRTEERVGVRKGKAVPVDASGAVIASGEESLDGPVEDAIDLVHRLAESPRVRQSFVRHAFRYWMGRNEMLSDSPALIAADQAYVESDGSFTELLVSLLTSDSFLYRR